MREHLDLVAYRPMPLFGMLIGALGAAPVGTASIGPGMPPWAIEVVVSAIYSFMRLPSSQASQ